MMRWGWLLLLMLLNSSGGAFEYVREDGKKRDMPELHHVLDARLLDSMHPPKGFTLSEQDRLQCATCHAIEDIFEIPNDEVDKDDPDFLRGGPYANVTEFCYQCHEKKAHQRPNIHILLDENGDIIKANCKYCHEKVLKRDKAQKLDQLKLRQAADKLCYACHLKTPHLNAVEHSVELKDAKLEQWKKSTQENDLYMPLSDEGKVICITCHTPHQQGVLDDKLAAAKQVANADLEKGVTYKEHPWGAVYRADKAERLEDLERESGAKDRLDYQRIEQEVLLRLPAKDGSLCLSCHTFEY